MIHCSSARRFAADVVPNPSSGSNFAIVEIGSSSEIRGGSLVNRPSSLGLIQSAVAITAGQRAASWAIVQTMWCSWHQAVVPSRRFVQMLMVET